MLYYILRDICKVLFRLWLSIEINGKEKVPQGGGYIIICNHQSNLDPVLMSFGVKKQIRFMGKKELFEVPVLKWIFYGIGGFPVDRGSGDSAALDKSKDIINNGEILGMFPEGTRSKDGVPLRPKSGVAMIAGMTNSGIMPCGITYSKGLKFRSKVTINYGDFIPVEELGFGEEFAPRQVKFATKHSFSKVLELIGRGEDVK